MPSTSACFRFVFAPVSALLLSMASSASAATLIVDSNGKLTGATGVIVDGTLYNVTFVDGTCAQIFSGCDDVSDFDFGTSADAQSAAQALLDQVFIESGAGMFDTDPASIAGCESPLYCLAYTPFGFLNGIDPQFSAAFNQPGSDPDVVQFYYSPGGPSALNTSFVPWSVWADFTPSVPEPSTWAMMLFGFGAIGFSMRRRRRAELALNQIA